MTKNTLLKLVLVLGVIAISPTLLAETTATIGDQLDNVQKDVRATGSLFRWIVALVGAFFVFGGINGLKKYSDDPRSNPLMKPLIMTICGGLALGFGAFTTMLAGSATGEADGNEEIFEADSAN